MPDEVGRNVARALRQLSVHPRVKSLSEPRKIEGGVEVIVHFDSGLANRWRAQGQSSCGVKAVEPLTFIFRDSYPLDPPLIFLRIDFDRSHPHLQPAGDRYPPVPCYVFGNPRELMRLRGINGIADQLALWLQKASELSLVDASHGWEPVRRDHIDDVVVADAAAIRSFVGKDEGAAFLDTWAFREGSAAGLRRNSLWVTSAESTPLSANTLGEMFEKRPHPSIGIVAWSGKRADGSQVIADVYRPENVATVEDLLHRADDLGCGNALRAKFTLVRQRIADVTLPRPLLLGLVLIARRPFDLIGEASPLELCPYLIEVNGVNDLDDSSTTTVRLMMHRSEISPALLRQSSGLKPIERRLEWSLLGCGSLGSKIAVHLARQASGPGVLVDTATMLPHNFARHALFPFAGPALQDPAKAAYLVDAMVRLRTKAVPIARDIAEISMNGDRVSQTAVWGHKDFILDTTGSATVTEALCSANAAGRPRAIETCLYGGGRVAYAAIEGPKSNPSVLDLQAEAFRLMTQDPETMELVFSMAGQEVMIGQGCSAITSPMPDSLLSASAAPLAARVGRAVDEGLPPNGELLIGKIAADALGQTWHKEVVAPFTVLAGGLNHPAVHISPRVVSLIDEEIAHRPGVETGGVIVGRFSDLANVVTIVELIPAPADSTYKAHEFVLGTLGLAAAIDDIVSKSGGTLYSLGTWHNHLDVSGASTTDVGTAALIAIGQTFPALLLIRTPAGFTPLWAEAVPKAAVDAGVVREDSAVEGEIQTNLEAPNG